MMEASGRILRSDEVELDGQYQLGLLTDKSEVHRPERVAAVARVPEARIVENNPGFAVMEVTCSCGAKVCVKCDYSNTEAS